MYAVWNLFYVKAFQYDPDDNYKLVLRASERYSQYK